MRWILRRAMLAALASLMVKLVQYFLIDTGKPGSLSRR